ncbi:hypothetical protein H2203_007029 [Taxawa tesnikishii (nom. ined.)]|nr:hypothetical protein H2203_007029 [Dothideales sp. JES 119]
MARLFMSDSQDGSPSRASLITTYMMLNSQQTNVRRRIHKSSSPPTSPTASPHRRHGNFPPSLRGTSIPEEPFEDSLPSPVDADEDKLFDINKQIKTTLATLLNIESVRHDARMRQWVQSRLMDVEMQLKHQKRRRISTDSEGVVDSIADSLEHNDMPRKVSM